jgi:DNA repair photolyase
MPHSPAEYADDLPGGPVRGRGAGINPGNRFEAVRLHVLGDALDEAAAEHPCGVQVRTETIADASQSFINRVDSPDLNFSWTMNPYRGCEHGCIYCYARPTHELLGYSVGLDFETRIVVKRDAAAILKRELARPAWRGDPIMFAGVTDVYQPLEAKLRVTRACLEVLAECGQPVSIVTKNRLITRDIDLLRRLADVQAVSVAISLTTLDGALSRAMEPRASSPRDRLRAIGELREAGVNVMAMIAPVIPGLTDHELPRLLESAAGAGATGAAWMMLRLPYQVKDLFLDWLARAYPERTGRVERAIRDLRDGALNDTRFGRRMRGVGARAEHVATTFRAFARRYGLDGPMAPLSSASFRRPSLDGQLDLFD